MSILLTLALSQPAGAFTVCAPRTVNVLPAASATDVPVDSKIVLLIERSDGCSDSAWEMAVHDADGNELLRTMDVEHEGEILAFMDIALEPESTYTVTLLDERVGIEEEYTFTTGTRPAREPVDVEITDLTVFSSRLEGVFTTSPRPVVEPEIPSDPDLLLELAADGQAYQVVGTTGDPPATRTLGSRRLQGRERIDELCVTARSWNVAGQASEPSERCAEVDHNGRGGCSATSTGPAPLLPILALPALALLRRRRRSRPGSGAR